MNPDMCRDRVYQREGHPTIPQGSQEGSKIISNFSKLFAPPCIEEGFSFVLTLSNPTEVDALCEKVK